MTQGILGRIATTGNRGIAELRQGVMEFLDAALGDISRALIGEGDPSHTALMDVGRGGSAGTGIDVGGGVVGNGDRGGKV